MLLSPTTVARVFHETAFKNPNTRITDTAIALSTEYLRLFINEAVLRANEERANEAPVTEIDGIDNIVPVGPEDPENELDQFEDASDNELETRGLAIATQASMPSSADILDVRHLSSVAGLLVMDF